MSDASPLRRPQGARALGLWVTRSEPGATALAAVLAAAGHVSIKAPVLQARALHFPAPEGHFDAAVFQSAHGVRSAAPRLRSCFHRAYAIGRRTAAVLARAGVPAEPALIESSEGLLDLLPNPTGQRILLIAAVGGRNLLAPALRARGAQVVRLDVYERLPLFPDIDPRAVGAIIVSSGDGFRQATRVWLNSGGAPATRVLAPSRRVAALGGELGVTNVIVCDGAGPEAVLAALRRMEMADD